MKDVLWSLSKCSSFLDTLIHCHVVLQEPQVGRDVAWGAVLQGNKQNFLVKVIITLKMLPVLVHAMEESGHQVCGTEGLVLCCQQFCLGLSLANFPWLFKD